MDIEQQKQVAEKILFDLEVVDSHAILAGGAPRDWFFGKEATDLDFYFYPSPIKYLPDGKHLSLNKLISDFASLKFPTFIKSEYPYDDRNPHLVLVFDGEYDGMKVQFMCMNIPTEFVVDLFALNICHIWYKDGKINTTPAFDACVQSKTIHIINPLYGKRDKYVQKIVNKFPEFSLSE